MSNISINVIAAAAAVAIVPFTSIGSATAADLAGTEVTETAGNQRYGNLVPVARRRRICVNGRCNNSRTRVPGYDPRIRRGVGRDRTPPHLSLGVEFSGTYVGPSGPNRTAYVNRNDTVRVHATASDPESRIKTVVISGEVIKHCRLSGDYGTVQTPHVYVENRSPARFVSAALPARRARLVIPMALRSRCPDGRTASTFLYKLTAKAVNYAGQTVRTRTLTITLRPTRGT